MNRRADKRKLDDMKSALRNLEGSIEIGVFAVIYYVFWRRGYDPEIFPAYYGMGKYVLAGVYMLLVMVLFFNYEGFKFGYLKRTDILISQYLALFIANFITYWQLCLIANQIVSPLPLLAMYIAELVVALACVYVYTAVYHRLYIPKNMILVFGNDSAIELKFKMDTRSDKYRISKLISVKRGFNAICEEIVKYDAVILNDVPAEMRNDLLKFCYHNEIRTYVVPKLSDIIVGGATDICLFDTPLRLVRGRGLNSVQRFVKRAMDITLCMIAMVVAAPVMLLVAIAIKLEDGGPVFYKQKRVTRDGEVFEILKFRSMIVDAEKDGRSIPATERDPRITKVGRFTRATRIDELPQILNILKGDMSVVGPRPERVEHVEEYSRDIPEFAYRLKVKGGLTGFAQIYGKYNTSPYDKLRLDLMYIENYSLMLDIKLILMTIRIMLKKESTEGFGKTEVLEQMKHEALAELDKEENEEREMAAAGK